MTNQTRVSIDALQERYSMSRVARAAFDFFGQTQQQDGSLSIDDLQAVLRRAGHDAARGDIVDFFEALDDAGCGRFVVGTAGARSRFEWSVRPIDVGRSAAGKTRTIKEISGLESERHDQVVFVEHEYRLRADLRLCVALPADLTAVEAQRLGAFIQTLSVRE